MESKGLVSVFLKRYAREAVLSALLVLVIAGVYGQVTSFEFAALDDPTYVGLNYVVKQGVTLHGIKWAFTAMYAANWHPLAWISHMLDCELYGMWPGMHHLTSVILHAFTTLLLFLLLRYATGAVWRSAVVAALFALHPLHVESVAWIAERKDVLAAFFWMLTMLGYVRYAKRPSFTRYLPVALLFALGLMAKPMLVTLPFVLLLFDFWPLKRFEKARPGPPSPGVDSGGGQGPGDRDAGEGLTPAGMSASRAFGLAGEKIPLFALSVASCVITFMAQKAGGAVSTLQGTPLDVRVSNALTSYAAYLWKMIWPLRLAVFYPLQETVHLRTALACLAFILLVTLAALLLWKRRPYLITGWLWYLGTLVPVIGFVQVGGQAMADRYTYIPLIGIFMAVVWGLSDLFGRWKAGTFILGTGASIVLILLAALTWAQAGTWKDSASLFTRAVSVTKSNFLSSNNLGCALYEKGDMEGAIRNFNEALRDYPGYAVAHANLGLAYEKEGRRDQAVAHYLEAMKLGSTSAVSHYVIAQGLSTFGCTREAMQEYRRVLELNPDHAGAWNELGKILESQGKRSEGMACYRKSLEISPGNTKARLNLIEALEKQGEKREALHQAGAALRNDPSNPTLRARLDELGVGRPAPE